MLIELVYSTVCMGEFSHWINLSFGKKILEIIFKIESM